MEPMLCMVEAGTRCDYKRNAKPYVACAYTGICISKKHATVEEYGTILVNKLKEM